MLLHLGQWDLGWPESLTPFDVFERQFADRLKELQRQPGVTPLVLSCNYNPLNCIITQCPPTDWRSPPMVDHLNEIMRRQAEAHKVPFLDTSDIGGPLWDSSSDFSHPQQRVLKRLISHVTNFVCHHKQFGANCTVSNVEWGDMADDTHGSSGAVRRDPPAIKAD